MTNSVSNSAESWRSDQPGRFLASSPKAAYAPEATRFSAMTLSRNVNLKWPHCDQADSSLAFLPQGPQSLPQDPGIGLGDANCASAAVKSTSAAALSLRVGPFQAGTDETRSRI